jgi:hypothetical protein
MTTQTAADIIVVMDESGSMSSMGSEPLQALNNFINEQKRIDSNSLFSLYTFSSKTRRVHFNIPLGEMKTVTDYHPDSFTALYDCISQAIDDKMATDRNRGVVLVIITDGQDNCSKIKVSEIKNKISSQEAQHNWQVIYLAANQDAFSAGEALNIGRAKTSNFSPDQGGLSSALAATTAHVSVYRQLSQTPGYSANVDFKSSPSK